MRALRASTLHSAALHCPLALYRGAERPAIKSIAASRCWLQNEHPTWSARFRAERLRAAQQQLASLCAAWARALFIERDLEPLLKESSSTLCCRLATFGQGSTAALKAGQHRIMGKALSRLRVEEIAPAF